MVWGGVVRVVLSNSAGVPLYEQIKEQVGTAILAGDLTEGTVLPSVRALRGFSIDEGRLAWVTPPGQNGNQSSVQVLAWSNDDFGQVQTVPGEQLTIVR